MFGPTDVKKIPTNNEKAALLAVFFPNLLLLNVVNSRGSVSTFTLLVYEYDSLDQAGFAVNQGSCYVPLKLQEQEQI